MTFEKLEKVGTSFCKSLKKEILKNHKLSNNLKHLITYEEMEEIRNIEILHGLLAFDTNVSIWGDVDTGAFDVSVEFTKILGDGKWYSYGVFTEKTFYDKKNTDLENTQLYFLLNLLPQINDKIVGIIEKEIEKKLEI